MQLYLLYLQIIPTFVPIKSNPIINKTSTAVMKKKTILFASCLLGKRNSSKRPGYTRRLSMEINSSSRRNSSCYYPHYGFLLFG